MVRQELTFHDNFKIASSKEYHNGKIIEEVHYDEQGRIHGIYCKWYGNGNLSVLYNCLDGTANGLCCIYYENGQMECETNYVYGIRNGIERRWSDNGQLEYEVTYVNGKVSSTLEKGVRKWI